MMKMARLLITIAYPVLLVLSSLAHAPPALKVSLLILPLTLVVSSGISRLTNARLRLALRVFTGIGVILACVLLFELRHENLQWLIVLQECTVLLIMGGIFGYTLINGGDALITRFIRFAHEAPSPTLLRYSRQLTAVWTLFFIASSIASMALYFALPAPLWALYNSVGIPICAVVLFILENLSQKFLLPREEQRTIGQVWRAVRAAQTSRGSAAKA